MSDDINWSGEMPDERKDLNDYQFYAGCCHNDHGRLYTETYRVAFSWNDGGDEPNFAWIVELTNGKFAAVSGSHDYTGWDCQSSLGVDHVGDTEIECVQYLTDDPRRAWLEERS